MAVLTQEARARIQATLANQAANDEAIRRLTGAVEDLTRRVADIEALSVEPDAETVEGA